MASCTVQLQLSIYIAVILKIYAWFQRHDVTAVQHTLQHSFSYTASVILTSLLTTNRHETLRPQSTFTAHNCARTAKATCMHGSHITACLKSLPLEASPTSMFLMNCTVSLHQTGVQPCQEPCIVGIDILSQQHATVALLLAQHSVTPQHTAFIHSCRLLG